MPRMGKLVACKSCGEQVSTAAKACPKCGQPAKRGLGMGKIIGLAIIAVIIIGAVGASSKKEQQRKEVAEPTSPPIEVSAEKLASDYKANEVSADEMYRGKVLRVSGVVEAIKKDITDDPYMVIKTNNMFLGVHAKFDSPDGLSRIPPGKQVTVRCIGNNVIMGSPMLKDCVLE